MNNKILDGVTHKAYLEELDGLAVQMRAAQELAERFPCFAESILRTRTVQQGTRSVNLGNKYKKLHLRWGINLSYYGGDTNRTMTNYKGKQPTGEFVYIYVNSYSLFDVSNEYGLSTLAKHVFYYDTLNSTFYVEPDGLCEFMEKLHDWYLKASAQNCKDTKQKEIEAAERKLASLKETNCAN